MVVCLVHITNILQEDIRQNYNVPFNTLAQLRAAQQHHSAKDGALEETISNDLHMIQAIRIGIDLATIWIERRISQKQPITIYYTYLYRFKMEIYQTVY